jgi:hypothetical protein
MAMKAMDIMFVPSVSRILLQTMEAPGMEEIFVASAARIPLVLLREELKVVTLKSSLAHFADNMALKRERLHCGKTLEASFFPVATTLPEINAPTLCGCHVRVKAFPSLTATKMPAQDAPREAPFERCLLSGSRVVFLRISDVTVRFVYCVTYPFDRICKSICLKWTKSRRTTDSVLAPLVVAMAAVPRWLHLVVVVTVITIRTLEGTYAFDVVNQAIMPTHAREIVDLLLGMLRSSQSVFVWRVLELRPKDIPTFLLVQILRNVHCGALNYVSFVPSTTSL